jgi:hypothetical protein
MPKFMLLHQLPFSFGEAKFSFPKDLRAHETMAAAISNLKEELTSWITSLGAGQVSAEFFELIKGIGEAKSKQVRFQSQSAHRLLKLV